MLRGKPLFYLREIYAWYLNGFKLIIINFKEFDYEHAITDTAKIEHALNPEYLAVMDESHMHNVPAGAESHFKVTVSEQFNGKRLVARHQWINQILAEELAGKIHALWHYIH